MTAPWPLSRVEGRGSRTQFSRRDSRGKTFVSLRAQNRYKTGHV